MRSLLLVLLTLAVAPACSGGGGGTVVDAGTDAAIRDSGVDAMADAAPCTLVRPYSTGNAVCNACAQAHCCAEINVCLLDTECDDGYVNCEIGCALDPGSDAGPATCLADCARQFPRGQVEYDRAIGCADRACPTECM